MSTYQISLAQVDSKTKLMLFVPVIFILFSIFELYFEVNLTEMERFSSGLIIETFLLNTTHVAFTAFAFFRIPEITNWESAVKLPNRPRIYFPLTTIFLFLSVIYFVFDIFPELILMRGALAISYDLLLDWHAIGQSKGLQLMLNTNKKSTTERRLILSYFILFISLSFTEQLGFFKFNQFNTISVFLNLFQNISVYIEELSWVIILVLVGYSLFTKKESVSRFFCLRWLLWPLSYYSYYATIGILATHGLEYWTVSRSMLKGSSVDFQTAKNKKMLFQFVLFGLFLGFMLALSRWPHILNKNLLIIFIFFKAIIFSISVLHCVWDKYFFRPNIKETGLVPAKLLANLWGNRQ